MFSLSQRRHRQTPNQK